jgi:hypothetical protein
MGRLVPAIHADQLRACQQIKESIGRRHCEQSEAIQTKPRLRTASLDRFALLAMTDRAFIS